MLLALDCIPVGLPTVGLCCNPYVCLSVRLSVSPTMPIAQQRLWLLENTNRKPHAGQCGRRPPEVTQAATELSPGTTSEGINKVVLPLGMTWVIRVRLLLGLGC